MKNAYIIAIYALLTNIYTTQAQEIKGNHSLPICVNQVGYNTNGSKRFTVPTATKNLRFEIRDHKNQKVYYRGRLHDKIGDFSAFAPKDSPNTEYIVSLKNESGKTEQSYPFRIGERAIQEMSYAPTIQFMNDVRSLVGTHPSAFGGTPWRDGTYYTYEIPSLVLLYLSDPDYFKQMPIELNWEKDSANVLSPNFKKTKDTSDRDALTTVQNYYTLLPKPRNLNVPDIIQNIRFATGWYLLDPITIDTSGKQEKEKMHPQTIEQFAYFLYAYPKMQEYVSREFYELVLQATNRWWTSVGLFEVITDVGSGKGRETPGHSIMPNLMMYEVALRHGKHKLADKHMKAAHEQTQWIIEHADWNNPIYTKGQRINEHRLVTGLVHYFLNYKEQSPKGLGEKIENLGKRYVELSNNIWDFRRYDLDKNWTIPEYNECGNVIAFPACALGVAMCVDDKPLKDRLEEIAYAHFDHTFGRNPLNTHAANHPENGFMGVEAGFPYSYHNNVCARLELTRGSLSSLPGSEMYPYNPTAKHRWPEGWTAYNAGWNVSLAFLNFYEGHSSIKVLAE